MATYEITSITLQSMCGLPTDRKIYQYKFIMSAAIILCFISCSTDKFTWAHSGYDTDMVNYSQMNNCQHYCPFDRVVHKVVLRMFRLSLTFCICF